MVDRCLVCRKVFTHAEGTRDSYKITCSTRTYPTKDSMYDCGKIQLRCILIRFKVSYTIPPQLNDSQKRR